LVGQDEQRLHLAGRRDRGGCRFEGRGHRELLVLRPHTRTKKCIIRRRVRSRQISSDQEAFRTSSVAPASTRSIARQAPVTPSGRVTNEPRLASTWKPSNPGRASDSQAFLKRRASSSRSGREKVPIASLE